VAHKLNNSTKEIGANKWKEDMDGTGGSGRGRRADCQEEESWREGKKKRLAGNSSKMFVSLAGDLRDR